MATCENVPQLPEGRHLQTVSSTPSSTTSDYVSSLDEEGYEKNRSSGEISNASDKMGFIFTSDLHSLCSAEDLEHAVDVCKVQVLESEERSEERRWLVRRLVELRLRLQQLQEEGEFEGKEDMRFVFGHHLKLQPRSTAPPVRLYCDRCTGLIWSVLHSWYQCDDCKYSCHTKCVMHIGRICAHVRVSENPSYVLDICPEIGLMEQLYRCYECKAHITFKHSLIEPRRCDYDGHYYCPACHWNSVAIVPARVVHNWDFEERYVARNSLQFLQLMVKRPVLMLEEINPVLFSVVEELRQVKVCFGQGYICEICDEDEVIFPFDNLALVCPKCYTAFHRHCWTRKNQQCPKCQRREARLSANLNKNDEERRENT